MKEEEEEICKYIWMSEEDWKKINPKFPYPKKRMENSEKLSKEEYQKWFKKFEVKNKEYINKKDGKYVIIESIERMLKNEQRNQVKTVFQNSMKIEENKKIKKDYEDAIKEVFSEE